MSGPAEGGNTPLNPPDSPPAGPVVPEGLTTKLGKYAIALCAVIAGVAAIMPGDHGEVWKWMVAVATVVYTMLTASRGYQAGQLAKAAPALQSLGSLAQGLTGTKLSAPVTPSTPILDENAQSDLEATDGLPSDDETTAGDENVGAL